MAILYSCDAYDKKPIDPYRIGNDIAKRPSKRSRDSFQEGHSNSKSDPPSRKRRRIFDTTTTSQPTRKSARLENLRSLTDTKSSVLEHTSRATCTRDGKREPVVARKRAQTTTRDLKQASPSKSKGNSWEDPPKRKRKSTGDYLKRRRKGCEDLPGSSKKRSRQTQASQSKHTKSTEDLNNSTANHIGPVNRPPTANDSYVEDWLGSVSWSRGSLSAERTLIDKAKDMSSERQGILPSPGRSNDPSGGGASVTSSSLSRRSVKTTASVQDRDFRKSLGLRNIWIEKEGQKPPPELVQNVRRIVTRTRSSPELDDHSINRLQEVLRRLQDSNEDDHIFRKFVEKTIPTLDELEDGDSRLKIATGQLWSDRVPVPLKHPNFTTPLPLPQSKPDFCFGYSEIAFTDEQNLLMNVLVDDSGRSYAAPGKMPFPFLNIERKSQATGGTIHVATNQAANAGAVVMNNRLELAHRSFGTEEFDFNEPQFFSVTLDQKIAEVNVHWIQKPQKQGDAYGFHLENLSQHFLKDPAGIRALQLSVKNIIDEGLGTRLKKIQAAIDKYGENIKEGRAAMEQAQTMPPPPEPIQSIGSAGALPMQLAGDTGALPGTQLAGGTGALPTRINSPQGVASAYATWPRRNKKRPATDM